MVHFIVMTPKPAHASRAEDMNLDSLEVYFFYEDHIGRPVMASEYYDADGDGYFLVETTVLESTVF